MHLYVHIPFCHRICPYCAFFKHTPASTDMKLFIRALGREAESRAAALSAGRGGETDTLYFGGGTPSMLSDTHLGRLMETLVRLVPVDKLDEFSFEANPATFTEKKVRFWRSLGMTRVSLGVQSLDSGILRLLGREHTPDQALRSVEMLKNAGMPHINMDLMFAIPGQPLSIWEATLKEAVRAGTDHISAYNLTYEEDTEFFRSLLRGEKRQDPDEDAAYFELAEHMLEAAGMRHYETSNYAREGCLSPHNMAYWKGEDYVGIGPGAVSTINGIRYSNTRDTDAYIRSTLENGLPLSEQEPVTEEDYRLERIALMLRTDEGLPLKYILPESRPLLGQYRELGLADISPEQRLILKGRGRLLVDAIAAELC